MHDNATEQANKTAAALASATWLSRVPRRIGRVLRLWQERRRQRRALAGLSDVILKDIGLTRLEAEREAIKRPWCK